MPPTDRTDDAQAEAGKAALPPEPTLPAMAGKRASPRRAVQVRPSKAMELGAVAREMDSAIQLARVCGIAVALLIVLTALRALGVFPLPLSDVSTETWAAQASSPWPRSVQALLLLLVSTQLVMVLLVTEHRINELGDRQPWEDLPRWLRRWQRQLSRIPASVALSVALWALRALVVGLVAGAILTDLWRRSWWDVVVLGVFAQVLTSLIILRTDQATRAFRDEYHDVAVDEDESDGHGETNGTGETNRTGGGTDSGPRMPWCGMPPWSPSRSSSERRVAASEPLPSRWVGSTPCRTTLPSWASGTAARNRPCSPSVAAATSAPLWPWCGGSPTPAADRSPRPPRSGGQTATVPARWSWNAFAGTPGTCSNR